MFDALIEVFNVANSLSPLAIIGLLVALVWMLVRGRTAADAKVDTLATNHLHELPELVENSRKTVEILQRIEVRLGEDFSYIKARINGTGKN